MENTTGTIENPTPPRDLQLLIYVVKQGKKEDFIDYYQNTITSYLVDEGVKDAAVWTFKLDNRTLFAIATSPTIPPWFGVPRLRRLVEFVEELPESIFENRPDLHIHEPMAPISSKKK